MELEIDSIKNLLHLIQNEELPGRVNNIKTFQQLVWNNEFITKNALVDDILLDLAYDLDFYEPNPDWRKEDISFYGEDRLVENIQKTLQAIEALEIKNKNE